MAASRLRLAANAAGEDDCRAHSSAANHPTRRALRGDLRCRNQRSTNWRGCDSCSKALQKDVCLDGILTTDIAGKIKKPTSLMRYKSEWAKGLFGPLGANPGTSAGIQHYRCHEHQDAEPKQKPLCEIIVTRMRTADSAQDYFQRDSRHAKRHHPTA